MTKLKFEKKERLTRKDAAARLSAIAESLSSDGDLDMARDGESIKMSMASHVRYEFEVEIDGEESEIEIELKWQNSAEPTTQAKPTTRRGATSPKQKPPSTL